MFGAEKREAVLFPSADTVREIPAEVYHELALWELNETELHKNRIDRENAVVDAAVRGELLARHAIAERIVLALSEHVEEQAA